MSFILQRRVVRRVKNSRTGHRAWDPLTLDGVILSLPTAAFARRLLLQLPGLRAEGWIVRRWAPQHIKQLQQLINKGVIGVAPSDYESGVKRVLAAPRAYFSAQL